MQFRILILFHILFSDDPLNAWYNIIHFKIQKKSKSNISTLLFFFRIMSVFEYSCCQIKFIVSQAGHKNSIHFHMFRFSKITLTRIYIFSDFRIPIHEEIRCFFFFSLLCSLVVLYIFFPCYLSLTDSCDSSSLTPLMLTDILTEGNIISFWKCMIQNFDDHISVLLRSFCWQVWPLTTMCLSVLPDHHKFKYMRPFSGVTLPGSFVHATVENLFTNWLPFFGTNDIDHFICDVSSVEAHQEHLYIFGVFCCCCQHRVQMPVELTFFLMVS